MSPGTQCQRWQACTLDRHLPLAQMKHSKVVNQCCGEVRLPKVSEERHSPQEVAYRQFALDADETGRSPIIRGRYGASLWSGVGKLFVCASLLPDGRQAFHTLSGRLRVVSAFDVRDGDARVALT